jgi:hypothetical protein
MAGAAHLERGLVHTAQDAAAAHAHRHARKPLVHQAMQPTLGGELRQGQAGLGGGVEVAGCGAWLLVPLQLPGDAVLLPTCHGAGRLDLPARS